METRSFEQKMDKNYGPKRILTLDGGGVRGVLSLGILKKIETMLREKHENPKLLLGDYYDLIGGTSTGAIIASGLAIGKSVDELISLYKDIGGKVFEKGRKHRYLRRSWKIIRALYKENYDSKILETHLKEEFKEIHLGDSDNIRCGLAINAKRADTYSLWTFANNPKGKYYHANCPLKLWELCRASSAAPYYFKPVLLKTRTRKGDVIGETAFIDGGVSLANNPAFQTFLVATTNSFGFEWETGVDKLLITSIGTGSGVKKEKASKLVNARSVSWAAKMSYLFMQDALEQNDIMLHILGKNVGPEYHVDSQFEELSSLKSIAEPLFSYQRHTVILTENELKKLGFSFTKEKIESLCEMDHAENIDDLIKIGTAYADLKINIENL